MSSNLKSNKNTTTIRFKDEYTRHVANVAAKMQGQSLTSFILSAVRERAEAVIKERKQVMQEVETIILSPKASIDFLQTMMNPPRPNKEMLAALFRHKKHSIKSVD